MRSFRTIIFSTLIIIIVSACSYRMPRHLTNSFTYKYTPDKKDLTALINTDGYYTEIRPDSFYMNYLFFNDGVAIENLYGSDRSNSPDKLPTFLTKMASDTTDNMSLWGTWGTYIISGDTIKAQFIHRSISLNDGWTGWEEHFKVIDRESIKLIYMKPLHKLSASDRLNYSDEFYRQKIKDYQSAVFIKSEGIPKSDSWMKKEKWFWQNEGDYNHYIIKVQVDSKAK
jgi:hypothetical protein